MQKMAFSQHSVIQSGLTGVCDKSFARRRPEAMDRLARKYMMCKVDSSSDSELDTSPRWSDASCKFLQGCTDLKRPTLPQKPIAWHYPQTLDPYDGSSEDSASSDHGPKRQKHKGFRMKGRSRRAATNHRSLFEVKQSAPRDAVALMHLTDIQMRSSGDSEGDFLYRARKRVTAEVPEKPFLYPLPVPLDTDTSNEFRSPTHPATLSKRKMFCPLGDNEEYIHQKKQCITQMESETIFSEG